MRAQKTTRSLTVIFFMGMILCYVAYHAGVFEGRNNTQQTQSRWLKNSLQANNVVHHIDTPPANTHLDTSSEEFWIMAGSKSAFPGHHLPDITLSDSVIRAIQTEERSDQPAQQSRQQLNAPLQSDTLHK